MNWEVNSLRCTSPLWFKFLKAIEEKLITYIVFLRHEILLERTYFLLANSGNG